MFQLKRLTPEGIERALGKVERYRLLNEPAEAESICRDVLDIDGDNQEALVSLLLSLTDQFAMELHGTLTEAQSLLPRLEGDYERAYYAGIICERCAKAQLASPAHRSGEMAYHWLIEAMAWYEKAEAIRPPANDEAILRWNTCARLLGRDERLAPAVEEPGEPPLE
jgi:hypothetical protein